MFTATIMRMQACLYMLQYYTADIGSRTNQLFMQLLSCAMLQHDIVSSSNQLAQSTQNERNDLKLLGECSYFG